MAALSTWAPEDGLLGAVAPLALAAVRPTALVVDLDEHGPDYSGELTLARLVAAGPRRVDLEPSRTGTAVLPNGGVDADDAAEVLQALLVGWPDVVLRCPVGDPHRGRRLGVPLVPFRALLPAAATPASPGPAAWQSAGWRMTPPGPGPVLPRPAAATVRALLEGTRPMPGRWLRAVGRVWEHPWR